jgi:short-subunit dehydrogenase
MGFNLVLVSRTLSKLEQVCSEIKKAHPVEVKLLARDFNINSRVNYYQGIV